MTQATLTHGYLRLGARRSMLLGRYPERKQVPLLTQEWLTSNLHSAVSTVHCTKTQTWTLYNTLPRQPWILSPFHIKWTQRCSPPLFRSPISHILNNMSSFLWSILKILPALRFSLRASYMGPESIPTPVGFLGRIGKYTRMIHRSIHM